MITYTLGLCWISFFRIIAYRKRLNDTFSNIMVNGTKWISTLVLTNLGVLTLILFVIIYSIANNLGIPFTIAEDFFTLIFLLFFIYYLITKPEILPMHKEDNEKSDKKYAKVNLPEETRKEYAEKLEDYMQKTQPFLNDNISVNQISEKLNIPYHHLSLTINVEFDNNFYNYVNSHRIRYAEELLKDPGEREESILMIAYSSGFNSKTSFNKAFKYFNNMTPSEYRKNYSSENAVK